jgi:predicted anti-sigma-YlaC factor YlaD
MNCQLCLKESDAYLQGELPEDIRIQVENHLGICRDCAESYRLSNLAYNVILEEKGIESNPFLVTRIMAGIEELDQKHEISLPIPVYQNLFRSALIGTSVAAAILTGILVGNIYKPVLSENKLPIEMVYLDDAALEPVDLFSYE